MTLYDFKIGDRYIFYDFPYYLFTFTIIDIKFNEQKERFAIRTDNSFVELFILHKENTIPINNDVGMYLCNSDAYILKCNPIGKLYLKRKICELNTNENLKGGMRIPSMVDSYKTNLSKLKTL